MYVERLLQINTATLAALGTLMLGMGQQQAAMPLAMLAAAILSIWITDVKGLFAVKRGLAGILQVAALVLTLAWLPIRGVDKDGMIVALAQLLCYWQMVVLFQKKESRVYWHQTQLSLLQVVVAGLLTQGFLFGAMLIVYLIVALSALTLIFLYDERNRHRRAEPPAALAVEGSRWPLARQEPVFTGQTTGRLGVEREMFARVMKTAVVSLVLSLVVFLLVPRFGHGAWRGAGFSPRKTIGYHDEIKLGGLGEILGNPYEVLRIWFFDRDGEPYYPGDEVYLRGAVLAHYTGGRWRPPRSYNERGWDPTQYRPPAHGEDLVRQRIAIEPLSRDDLFCVWPFRFLPGQDSRVVFDFHNNRLSRLPTVQGMPFSYELQTTAFHNGRQSAIVPNEGPVRERELLEMPVIDGQNTLPGLTALAREWLDESGLAPEERCARARYLERNLKNTGQFQYSLKGQVRDLSLDPIEDFITKHPEGHCEYFATALAMMLRSQGIPSRVVIGYHSTERNAAGGYFLVRQLHAHAWVEAWLEFEHVPAELRDNPYFLDGGGGWLRLDPTPGSDQQAASGLGLDEGLNWLDYLWSRYVMQMDRPQQRESVYAPVADAVKEAAERVTDPSWWRKQFRALRDLLGLGQWGGEWLDGILAATLAVVIGLPVYRAIRWLWGLWTRPGTRRPSPSKPRPRSTIAFYRRLEAALARRGLIRPLSQTQREFALAVEPELARTVGPALAGLPGSVVEAFYRVRFGGVPLDKQEADTIERALGELERAASQQETETGVP